MICFDRSLPWLLDFVWPGSSICLYWNSWIIVRVAEICSDSTWTKSQMYSNSMIDNGNFLSEYFFRVSLSSSSNCEYSQAHSSFHRKDLFSVLVERTVYSTTSSSDPPCSVVQQIIPHQLITLQTPPSSFYFITQAPHTSSDPPDPVVGRYLPTSSFALPPPFRFASCALR